MRTGRGPWRVAVVCALLSACARLPVTDEMLIEPSKGDDSVAVTVSTRFASDPPNDAVRERIEAARAGALAGNDPWSVRMARLSSPEEERVAYDRRRGTLEQVTRSVLIPSDDLQQILSDTNITVDVLRGDGWRELTFYPGSSGRATREQQTRFDTELRTWSTAVARYFTAIHHLYSYLGDQPHRAEAVFAALTSGEAAAVAEEEQPLVDAVAVAMEQIAARMDAQEGSATALEEQADLLFNPFPARIIIRTPDDILTSEGFTRQGNEATIERIDLFAAIAELEGRWIAPDPLAALLRDQLPAAEELAAMKRRSSAVVSASEIAEAVREQLVRPKRYSVRWRE